MRVSDAELSIYEGLAALPLKRYLCAMWILCGEVQRLYEEQLSDADRSLMSATSDLARVVSDFGSDDETHIKAAALASQWQELIEADRRPSESGLKDARIVFSMLSSDLAGVNRQYAAADVVAGAVWERWYEPDTSRHRFVDPAEEIDDDGPAAQTLRSFLRVISAVTETPSAECDPVKLRTKLLS